MRLEEAPGQVRFVADSQQAEAAYRYGPSVPKPSIHPLITPAGHVLTAFEPADHTWQRGLWFAIKFVNSINYWEEKEPPFGVQVSKSDPLLISDRFEHELEWTCQTTGTVLREKRIVRFQFADAGQGIIDWQTNLIPATDITFDCTPFTTWGGYGGLAFRASTEITNCRFLIPGGKICESLVGEPHDWMLLQATMDGQPISIGMIDHPSNPRSPVPWYCRPVNDYILLNAAFLFHEPLAVKQGQHLHFKYRVIYRDGWWSANQVEELARSFRNE